MRYTKEVNVFDTECSLVFDKPITHEQGILLCEALYCVLVSDYMIEEGSTVSATELLAAAKVYVENNHDDTPDSYEGKPLN